MALAQPPYLTGLGGPGAGGPSGFDSVSSRLTPPRTSPRIGMFSKALLIAFEARKHWLTVEWLPKYAPELNDIEIVWRDLRFDPHLHHVRRLRGDQGYAPGRLSSLRGAKDCTGRLFYLGRAHLAQQAGGAATARRGPERNDHPLGCHGGRRASGAPRRRAFRGKDPPSRSLSALS